MAFTTEFVLGAGGSVEEIPVSMSGGGQNTVFQLATVDAGSGAVIAVTGQMNPASTSVSTRPHLTVGNVTHTEPASGLTGTVWGLSTVATGTVQVAILSRTSSTTTFTGIVYVARV